MAKSTSDKKLDRDLLKLAEKGQLADFIVDLLIEADRPEIELDGGSVVLRQASKPPTTDKSCYKKCLKESIDPKKPYSECIKKCKPKKKNNKLELVFRDLSVG